MCIIQSLLSLTYTNQSKHVESASEQHKEKGHLPHELSGETRLGKSKHNVSLDVVMQMDG